MSQSYDVVVIGGGPGGYVCAIRAAQLGFKVACIDKNKIFGGTCLRVGCIPSKALLESSELVNQAKESFKAHGIVLPEVQVDLATMQRRKSRVVQTLGRGVGSLLKKNGVDGIQGTARMVAPGRVQVTTDEGTSEIEAKNVIVATGSEPSSLPGVELDGRYVGSSTEALEYDEVPERLVVIGAGAIGLELGSVWNRLGSKVTVLEYLDRILPGADAEIADAAQKILAKQGLQFQLGARVEGVEIREERCHVKVADSDDVVCDRVLMAVGRRPFTDGLGLDEIGVQRDRRGYIQVDEHFKTNVDGVYAIGDVIGGAMLAHKAEEEGVALAEMLKTGVGHIDYNTVPAIVYTHPEVASVGKNAEELEAAGVPFKVGRFPFMANGRAKAVGETEGLVKVLAHQKTDRILGVHIVGPHAGDLLSEAVVAMTFGASSEDLARICHAHPTLTEAIKEACLDVDKRAVHA
ncbi:MAG: dihydrolipoyl dehydrogenase [Candidatus Eremiobacteraeota bacterium]|nr:dihydrolipoyl dehydrogenase [Candidatus Eremiobacteraeota bacterium]